MAYPISLRGQTGKHLIAHKGPNAHSIIRQLFVYVKILTGLWKESAKSLLLAVVQKQAVLIIFSISSG